MASTEGLVPITRSYLAKFYDKYSFAPVSEDVTRLSNELRKCYRSFLSELPDRPVVTYMPQDFRCSLFKQQRERSERRKQAEVDAVISSGGSIRDKYSLLWKQQMERRRQLAQLGSASGVYKTVVKYLVEVPEPFVGDQSTSNKLLGTGLVLASGLLLASTRHGCLELIRWN